MHSGLKKGRLLPEEMSYKDDLKQYRQWLDKHETGRVRAPSNTHANREKNRKKRKRAERIAIWKLDHPKRVRKHIMSWREKFPEKWRAYMREYMRKRNQALSGGIGSQVTAL